MNQDTALKIALVCFGAAVLILWAYCGGCYD